MKALFLLITLPESWDTFQIAISNFAPTSGLTSANVESSLLIEEVNIKNMDSTRGGNALYVRGRSKERSKFDDKGKGCSKSRGRSNIECYHCHKKGHMKKDCHLWKKEKGNDKKQEKKQDKNKDKASSSIVKIEEINAVSVDSEDGEILLISTLDSAQLVATDDLIMHDWILDSRMSFHVTPHKEWFSTYDASRKGKVCLVNDYACEIIGVGDVQIKFQSGSTFTLKNVRHVPKLPKSLISAGQLDDGGYSTIFGDSS